MPDQPESGSHIGENLDELTAGAMASMLNMTATVVAEQAVTEWFTTSEVREAARRLMLALCDVMAATRDAYYERPGQ